MATQPLVTPANDCGDTIPSFITAFKDPESKHTVAVVCYYNGNVFVDRINYNTDAEAYRATDLINHAATYGFVDTLPTSDDTMRELAFHILKSFAHPDEEQSIIVKCRLVPREVAGLGTSDLVELADEVFDHSATPQSIDRLITIYERALSKGDMSAIVGLARTHHYKKHDHANAIRIYENAIAAGNVDAMYHAAICYKEMNNRDSMRDLCHKMLDHDDTRGMALLAKSYSAEGRLSDALDALFQGMAKETEDTPVCQRCMAEFLDSSWQHEICKYMYAIWSNKNCPKDAIWSVMRQPPCTAVVVAACQQPQDEIIVVEDLAGKTWVKDGKPHRTEKGPDGLTLPAVIRKNGTREWWQNGERFRENDLPHVVHEDGTQEWFIGRLPGRNGDKPATIYADGTREWCIDGRLDRADDKPSLIHANGTLQWNCKGRPHRDKRSPTGELLPAVIHPDGTCEYWIHGERCDANCQQQKQDAGLYSDEKGSVGAAQMTIVAHGSGKREWRQNGQLHRVEKGPDGLTLPAIIFDSGRKEWYQNGQLHRDEKGPDGQTLPTVILEDGSMFWINHDILHRNDRGPDGYMLPAVIDANGKKMWYVCGLIHRDEVGPDGNMLPAIIQADGTCEFRKCGKRVVV